MPLIKAAIAHNGAAFIDVISPCVAFNNHAGSTKSFDYVREHNEAVNRLDFMSSRMPIEVKYEPGSVEVVEQHDGSKLTLRKLAADYDLHDRTAALGFLQHHAAKGQIVTGLLYMEQEAGRPARASAHGRDAAQRARRKGTVPGPGGARQDQRHACVDATCGCRDRDNLSAVIAGLDPAIHLTKKGGCADRARNTPRNLDAM